MTHRSEKHETLPYRSRSGMILGVCKGIAQHMEVSVFWIRVLAVLALVFTGFWPIVGIYFLAAILMKPEPVVPFKSEAEEEFYHSYASDRTRAVHRLKRISESLERRLQNIESTVTSKEYDWHRRLNR